MPGSPSFQNSHSSAVKLLGQKIIRFQYPACGHLTFCDRFGSPAYGGDLSSGVHTGTGCLQVVIHSHEPPTQTGVETEIKGTIYENLSGFFNHTWERNTKKGDILDKSAMSDRLSEIPVHKINFGLKYRFRESGFVKLTGKFVDDREVPVDASQQDALGRMAPFFVLDLSARAPVPVWKEHCSVYAGIENIFDRDYQETYGYPMPGRMFYGGFEMRY